MHSLSVPQPPQCLIDLQATKPVDQWFDGDISAERNCRVETREALLNNQDNLCGWCEQSISLGSSHSEHIQPKGNTLYKHLTRTIDNLIACCGKSNSPTCGHHKGENVLPHWVHPYQTHNIDEYFYYESDGEMVSHSDLSQPEKTEAGSAINSILNLNESVLKGKREAQLSDLKDYPDHSESELLIIFGEFPSVTRQYKAGQTTPPP